MTDPRHHGHHSRAGQQYIRWSIYWSSGYDGVEPQRPEPIRVEWFSGIVEPSARAWFNEPWSLFAAFAKTRRAKGQSRNSKVSALPLAPRSHKELDVQKAGARTLTFRTEVSARWLAGSDTRASPPRIRTGPFSSRPSPGLAWTTATSFARRHPEPNG